MMNVQLSVSEKLDVFMECMSCVGNITLWHFTPGQKLLFSSNQQSTFLDTIFTLNDCKQRLFSHCHQNRTPIAVSNQLSMLWLGVPVWQNEVLSDVYVLGPVFLTKHAENNLRTALNKMRISIVLQHGALKMLQNVPVCQHTTFLQYGAMLYHLLTDNPATAADVQIIATQEINSLEDMKIPIEWNSGEDSRSISDAIFKAVSDGNIHFTPSEQIYNVTVGKMSNGDPLRQAKNEMISYITLICRAAISGGLPSEVSYILSDHYVQQVEEATNPSAAYQCGQNAFDDYVHRVYREKLRNGYSKEVKECMDYIQLHLKEKISLDELTKVVGYNKSYLCSKFHKETGMTIWDCIMDGKIYLARSWLRHTTMSVRDISEALQFQSCSYFCAVFKKIVLCSPTEYRKHILLPDEKEVPIL